VRRERSQFDSIFANAIGAAAAPAIIDLQIAVLGPTQLCESLPKRCVSRMHRRIVGNAGDRAYAPHSLALLRACRERPRGCACSCRDEIAAPDVIPLHSITSSARKRNDSGMISPIALAVLRLTTSWYLEACSTGRSAGLVP